MALATTCPACSTSFKVNPEQLKLRRGLVRCGKCEHVFSGVEYLRYVSDTQTEADLNPPDTDGDRRRGDRRATSRTPIDEEPGTTDELKTAFFLPDTELADARSDNKGAASTEPADATAPDSGNTDDAKQSVDVSANADASTEDSAAADDAPAAEQPDEIAGPLPPSPAAPTKQGKRSRRHPKDAQPAPAAPDAAEQDTTETTPISTASANNLDERKPAMPDDGGTAAPQSTGTADTDAPKCQPARPRLHPIQPARPVVTAPLTQSPRSPNGSKTGRDDASWVKAPVWPRIDEHFDEPDIEEPDSAPGPNPSSNPAGSSRKAGAGHPVATDVAGSDEDAIDFFGQTSKPTFDFDLPSRRAWLIAVALSLLLIVQLALGNRDVLASRFPVLTSPLTVLGKPLGLTVQLPMSSEDIKIASFDLVTASAREPGASYVMNLLMRNKAAYAVRWPAIELTLLDDAGGILVRKVLLADQYVPDQLSLERGLGASGEQPIRVGLKSHTSAPVGYSVSLFYP